MRGDIAGAHESDHGHAVLADGTCRQRLAEATVDAHRAEVLATHRAEVPLLVRVVGQRLVVVLTGALRVEGEVELILSLIYGVIK